MYPVTCIDVIESAAVSSLGSSNDSVCVRYFEFLVLLLILIRRKRVGVFKTVIEIVKEWFELHSV